MPTYRAFFRSDSSFAVEKFSADSPEQALRLAQEFDDVHNDKLCFEPYENDHPVNEIAIRPDDGTVELAVWRDPALRCQLAADDLLDAARLARRELREFYCNDSQCEALRVLSAAIIKAEGGT